ncbi:MAG: calcium-binding protein [Paracoccus sp. (in: a-proteobacteria)]
MLVEWAYIANALIFGSLALVLMADPFGDDDDDDTPPPEPGQDLAGTNNDDVIDGSAGPDRILGLGGDDLIQGFGGNDLIEGNTGNDTIYGGTGDDILAGGGGTDVIFGGPGNDILSSDRMDNDADWQRGGQETLSGGAGDDQLLFSARDIVTGGTGADDFRMVYDVVGDAARITDFDPAEDSVTLYADLDLNDPPQITVSVDETTGTTQVFVDDRAVLTLDGRFTAEQLSVTLRARETIFGDAGITL